MTIIRNVQTEDPIQPERYCYGYVHQSIFTLPFQFRMSDGSNDNNPASLFPNDAVAARHHITLSLSSVANGKPELNKFGS